MCQCVRGHSWLIHLSQTFLNFELVSSETLCAKTCQDIMCQDMSRHAVKTCQDVSRCVKMCQYVLRREGRQKGNGSHEGHEGLILYLKENVLASQARQGKEGKGPRKS